MDQPETRGSRLTIALVVMVLGYALVFFHHGNRIVYMVGVATAMLATCMALVYLARAARR